jgi:hypothetical protein
MEMTLAKALKHKNRVGQRISTIGGDIQTYNSILAVNEREVDVKALDAMREELLEHLVTLKTAIHRASDKVRKDIFMLAELKGSIRFYRSISTQHGKCESRGFGRFGGSDEFVEHTAVLRKEDIDRLVALLEEKIDTMQDRLDEFNAVTKINIDIPDAMSRPYAPISTG